MNRSCLPAAVLKLGILGVFLFGAVVAAASFALFGCICGPLTVNDIQAEKKPVDVGVAPNSDTGSK
jgi:hypothetical protein